MKKVFQFSSPITNKQMSTKIGGCPWMVELPPSLKGLMVSFLDSKSCKLSSDDFVFRQQTIGFDVSHGTKQERHSYGGFVASMDLTTQQQRKFYSAVIRHERGNEVSGQLTNHVKAALEMY
jgi:hypothetical protein